MQASGEEARPLYLVLTRLGFVEIFTEIPTASRRGWRGRRVYVLDPLTVDALDFRSVLTLDMPRRFQFGTGRSRWMLWRINAEDVEILRDGEVVLTFCWRLVRLVQMAKCQPWSLLALQPQ